jgi:Na+/H+ antiporter NhaD/arsenite permease-like protein
MTPAGAAAAAVFLATFLLLALGRVGRLPVPRGWAALAGGVLTAAILVPAGAMEWTLWRLVDLQVILLLAGLMALAGLAHHAGLLSGLDRRLAAAGPRAALLGSLALVAAASALLLNDAAVVVLVPLLLPLLLGRGVPAVPAVALMAAAANVGSLLTPFGNPQNAALASHAGLSLLDFLRAQAPIAAAGLAGLAAAGWWATRGLPTPPAPPHTPVPPRGRAWVAACIGLFLAAAVLAPGHLGTAAAAGAILAYAGLRLLLGREADRAAWECVDPNVLALFVGLYLLTGGLGAWFPSDRMPLAALDGPAPAALATTLLSNVVGNVPAILTFVRLDPEWTRLHAHFLVSVSTLGGALLLTGSAASLLAADQARPWARVRFLPFARWAAPAVLPALLLAVATGW